MRRVALVGAAAALLLAAGCGAGSTPSGGSTPATTLTVFAAASLTRTFTVLGTEFESEHPGTTVRFSFAGSSDLVTQLEQGAPADVLASADPTTMAKATAADLVDGTPVTFASNTLEIAVPPGNPARITSFADLARPGLDLVVCAPAVPCGAAAQQVQRATGVRLRPVSEESAVTDVLTKVQSGEADAGLVYVTDVKGAGGKVEGVPFRQSATAVNEYPIAALRGSTQPELARQFTALVTGPRGRQVLAGAGFAAP